MPKLLKDEHDFMELLAKRRLSTNRKNCKYPRDTKVDIKSIPHDVVTLSSGDENWDFGGGCIYKPTQNRIVYNGKEYTAGASLIHEVLEAL